MEAKKNEGRNIREGKKWEEEKKKKKGKPPSFEPAT